MVRRATVAARTPPAPGYVGPAGLDDATARRALEGRDPRLDGRIWVAVTTTGIYCRPVCPSRTPLPEHVRYFAAPAAAVAAGFRACKRCRPDAAPGARTWDHRTDLAGRAMRLIADGAVDDGGVAGLALRLGVGEGELHRVLLAEVGAGPRQLAVSRRARTARLLIDQTELGLAEIAYAAGFSGTRQLGEVIRREFGCPPSQLRRAQRPDQGAGPSSLVLRLPLRPPYDAESVGAFLAARVVPGLERHCPGSTPGGWRHVRPVPLPGGVVVVSVEPYADHVLLRTRHADLHDTATLLARVRRWLDLDLDPPAVTDVLAGDPVLAASVRALPGLRVPTTVDPWETCVRAVIGQQITVRGAGTLLGRLVEAYGEVVADPVDPGASLRAFPGPEVLAAAGPEAIARIGMPASRGRTLHGLADAVASGAVPLDGDRADVLAALTGLPGIGPWTRDYIALRALADPDAFPASDLGLRHAARRLGLPAEDRGLVAHAQRWRPWRAYAAQLLWTAAA